MTMTIGIGIRIGKGLTVAAVGWPVASLIFLSLNARLLRSDNEPRTMPVLNVALQSIAATWITVKRKEWRVDPIRWDENFSVGVEILNRQHRQIIQLINQLRLDTQDGLRRDSVVDALRRLLQYSRDHFAAEEGLLERHGYPDLDAHRQQHRAFAGRLLDFCACAAAGQEALADDMLLFLSNWWVWHIQCEDMEYRPLLEARRA